ncbi:MAG: hypothetical protein EA424_22025 [Planctomycetaceae bacterium]|nr:MAG: hypothetical protein EA424_22025 [Planctomycetaceae bacterium]
MPRATQGVDVMVSFRERKRAVQAIRDAWPNLIVRELSQMVRFLDPVGAGYDGRPKVGIDLMQAEPPFGARGMQAEPPFGARGMQPKPPFGARGMQAEPPFGARGLLGRF